MEFKNRIKINTQLYREEQLPYSASYSLSPQLLMNKEKPPYCFQSARDLTGYSPKVRINQEEKILLRFGQETVERRR